MADTEPTPAPAAARLAYLRSRHYRLPDTDPVAGAGICAGDRHRWPCHASVLLDVAETAVTLGTQWQTMPHLALTQEECGEQLLSDITSILLGEEATGGDGS